MHLVICKRIEPRKMRAERSLLFYKICLVLQATVHTDTEEKSHCHLQNRQFKDLRRKMPTLLHRLTYREHARVEQAF